jgi:hypothetical protein
MSEIASFALEVTLQTAAPIPVTSTPFSSWASFSASLNGRWHKLAMRIFMLIVLGHWAEHIIQAIQIYVLGWPRPQALGLLGLIWPWLVSSESLHYAYALVMLVGLIALRPAFTGEARRWWNISLGIQVWHHFEHLLLLGQVIVGMNLLGAAVPTSILQLVFPRVELHLTYNGLVTLPMLVAMYYHLFPPARDRRQGVTCTCAVHHEH